MSSRQALCHLSDTSAPVFEIVSCNLAFNSKSTASVPQVAGITDVCYHSQFRANEFKYRVIEITHSEEQNEEN
jgi:hypothetical protein